MPSSFIEYFDAFYISGNAGAIIKKFGIRIGIQNISAGIRIFLRPGSLL
jgi:hypothetical protein